MIWLGDPLMMRTGSPFVPPLPPRGPDLRALCKPSVISQYEAEPFFAICLLKIKKAPYKLIRQGNCHTISCQSSQNLTDTVSRSHIDIFKMSLFNIHNFFFFKSSYSSFLCQRGEIIPKKSLFRNPKWDKVIIRDEALRPW